jgi:hypothetical protein
MTKTDLPTTHFVRKPFYVDGIRVTKENMAEVAEWCKGTLKETEPKVKGKKPSPFIEVEVHRPANDRQRRAFVGDWVLQAENGFKVYTDVALKATFEIAVLNSDDAVAKLQQKFNG